MKSMRNRLLAGTFVLFAARLVLSLIRSGPVLVADEMGYLGNARAIADGIDSQMQLAPFYRAGYSLLIAPLVAIGSSPEFTYHLVLVLNAALAASVLPLLYLLLTRFAGVRPEIAFWAALAGAVYPALTVLSQVAMSENALFPLVCLWLLAFAGLWEARERGNELLWGLAFGAATGALWAVHNRMIVAVALALAALAWLAYRRRLSPAALALALGAIALAFLGTHLLDNFVVDHNYGGSAKDELSSRMDELSSFVGLRTAAANFLGQSWYLLVATFGLAAAAAGAFFRDRPRVPVLGALLALTVLLLAISAAAFPERSRPDQLIYGRYAEVVAPALIAFGVAALAGVRRSFVSLSGANDRSTWLPGALLGFGALTFIVVLIRATAEDPDAANRWNISALPFVTVQLGPAILIGAALVAAAGAALLLLASARNGRTLGVLAVLLFLPVVAYGAWNPVRSSERAVYPSGWTSPQGPAEEAGAKEIAYDLDRYDTIGLYVFQWFLPDSRIALFHGDREAAPAPFVLSGAGYGREHRGQGAGEIWSAAGRDQVLWRLSGRQAP
jgi:hypothetical protein